MNYVKPALALRLMEHILRPLTDAEIDTKRASCPSLRDMIKLLHVTDCELAQAVWQDAWTFCPVCGGQRGQDSFIRHVGYEL